MFKYLAVGAAIAVLISAPTAKADTPVMLLQSGCGTGNLSANNNIAGLSVDNQGRLCVYTGGIVITGNAAGTTGSVVGTLAAATGKTTYLCGFNVQAIGRTAAVGPITVAGLTGSSMTFQGSSTAAGGTVAAQNFSPCIPASAANTAITVTTTADGTATAVNVNSWGYQQ